ncbi:thiamine phosphate synthase [Aquimarina brevivitae]|uniref:Thiamine-phosphate synthase n=1 Tax=Aquimarina brevivitae TaxID=323412 RepID=A0A4Q7PGH3_9FLAO|nr:thiamine phosphate synthase [Aquimarina brevivitae]RZS99606.1 thiamine-phosphate diphosphorylase [Aquimarina brevivitae]
MKEYVKIQYISQGTTAEEHLDNIKKVCDAGIKWVQLRLKNVDFETYLQTAIECKKICTAYGALCIINDNVSIAKQSNADGVHLGLNDMNPRDARAILGHRSIIGGTANTIQDCLLQVKNGVDYIGLGPYKFTKTKQQLSPILGLSGYKEIVEAVSKINQQIPVIAIGGITAKDIRKLINVGVDGIAVSGLLSNNPDLKETVTQIRSIIKTTQHGYVTNSR